MRSVNFTLIAFDQYNEWAIHDKKLFTRIGELIVQTARSPFDGIGKPEALKFELKGCWSRRISSEHRLVYQV